MDETTIRNHAQAHADAVVNGDMDAITEDFAEAMRPQIRDLARALPRPVTGAEVLQVDAGDPVSVALIRYAGESGEVTIRSEWQEEDGRPRIVQAEPASD